VFPPPLSLFYPSTEYSRDYPRSPQIHVSAGVVPRHWKGMENGDPPLMTSWAPEAMELFREERGRLLLQPRRPRLNPLSQRC